MSVSDSFINTPSTLNTNLRAQGLTQGSSTHLSSCSINSMSVVSPLPQRLGVSIAGPSSRPPFHSTGSKSFDVISAYKRALNDEQVGPNCAGR